MSKKKILNFKTRVLGLEAAGSLKNKDIIQTIRSASSDCVKDNWVKGTLIEIHLDGEFVGIATVAEIRAVKFSNLIKYDAERGGFENLEALSKALKKFGW